MAIRPAPGIVFSASGVDVLVAELSEQGEILVDLLVDNGFFLSAEEAKELGSLLYELGRTVLEAAPPRLAPGHELDHLFVD